MIKLDPGTTKLPTTRDGSLEEQDKGIEVVDGIPARRLGPGYSENMTLELAPGDYVFVCNVVIAGGPFGTTESHYQMGMSTEFAVT